MTPSELGCDCANCPFAVGGKAEQFIQAEGPSQPDGVVFCDVPTSDEARRGEAMSPRSRLGQAWGDTLAKAGIDRDRLLHVPATACVAKAGAKKSEIAKAVKCCAPMRAEAVKRAETLPHLVLGGPAYVAVTGRKDGFMDSRGFIEGKRIVTFSPQVAYWWDTYKREPLEIDVARFGRLMRDQLEPLPTLTVEGVSIAHIVARAKLEGWVAFDIETMPAESSRPWTAKDATLAVLRTISLGWPDAGYAFLVEDLSHEDFKRVADLLADEGVTKVGQNIIWYDNRVLARHGITVRNFEDCRDLRRAISSTSPLSLGYMATLCTDAPPWKSDDFEVEEPDTDEDERDV